MDKYISTKDAALIAEVSKVTIRSWIKDFNIGKKVGGRWKVDSELLNKVLEGKIYYETQGRPKKSD